MRSERIMENIDLGQYMIDDESMTLVLPGDLITAEQGFMNGHGTYKTGRGIHAALMGRVQITNKLIIVNPLNNKYTPQVGDVVVGRVVEIANKRWKVDIRATAFGYLNLSAAYMNEQRKKNQEDQFNMRNVMQEGDMIVAEVQSLNNDRTVNLHTRNPKYGKLEPGTLVCLSHKLVKKQKHHMIQLNDVGMILGNNGNIWLSAYNRTARQTELREMERNQKVQEGEVDADTLRNISIVANLLKLLSSEGLEVSQPFLKQLLNYIQEQGIECKHILNKSNKLKNYILDCIQERIPKRLQQLQQNYKTN